MISIAGAVGIDADNGVRGGQSVTATVTVRGVVRGRECGIVVIVRSVIHDRRRYGIGGMKTSGG